MNTDNRQNISQDKLTMNALSLLIKDFFNHSKIGNCDFFNLPKVLGFDVRFRHLNRYKSNTEIDGILLVNEKEATDSLGNNFRYILINAQHEEYYNNFVLAHEISHYIFEKVRNEYKPIQIAEMRQTHSDNVGRSYFEQVIDYMAAELLIPMDCFKRDYNAYKEAVDKKAFIAEMSKKYKATQLTIEKRIQECKAIYE